MLAIPFDDVDTMLRETTDVFEPPKMQEYPELENIWDWLVDDSGRDQLLAYKDFDISIVWAPNKNSAATVSNLEKISNLNMFGSRMLLWIFCKFNACLIIFEYFNSWLVESNFS